MVISPGVPVEHPIVTEAKDKGVRVISELELQAKPDAPYTQYSFSAPWERKRKRGRRAARGGKRRRGRA